jgi:peptidoglycan hydrolase CwlO-like protein
MKKHFILLLSFCLLFPVSVFSDPVIIEVDQTVLEKLKADSELLRTQYETILDCYQALMAVLETSPQNEIIIESLLNSFKLKIQSLNEQLADYKLTTQNLESGNERISKEIKILQADAKFLEMNLIFMEAFSESLKTQFQDYVNEQKAKRIKLIIGFSIAIIGTGIVFYFAGKALAATD